MRGKHGRYSVPGAYLRSIPAHAGETSARKLCGVSVEVHPRTCGGNKEESMTHTDDKGPSPHMRGKRPLCFPFDFLMRSIPAHAGETSPSKRPPGPSAVHPRTCGGNIEAKRAVLATAGPSPHMRGKPF